MSRAGKNRHKTAVWPFILIIILLALVLAVLLLILHRVRQGEETDLPGLIGQIMEEVGDVRAPALRGESYEETEGLYVLNHGEDLGPCDYVLGIDVSGGQLVISYIYDEVVHAALYDFEAGDYLADISLGYSLPPEGDFDEVQGEYEDGYFSYGLEFCGDGLCYAVEGDAVCFFDSGLEFVARSERLEEGWSYTAGEGYVAAALGNGILLLYPDGSQIAFTLEDMGYAYPFYGDGGSVWLFGVNEWYDSVFARWDIAAGTVAYSGITEDIGDQGGGWLWAGENAYYSVAEPDRGFTTAFDEDEYLCAVLAKSVFTSRTDGGSLTLTRCDLETGGAAAVTVPGTEDDSLWAGDAFAEWEGYVIFPLYRDGELVLLVWQPGEEAASSPVKTAEGLSGGIETLGVPIGEYYAKSYENADLVLEGYEVGLYYTDVVAETEFYDYAAETCTDPAAVEEGIAAVTAFLDAMPEGFVAEVIYPWKGLDVYLSAAISPTAEGSIGNAAAFTTVNDDGDRAIIVLDVSGSYQEGVEQNFAHEFMHLIELTIASSCSMQLFPEWETYNPEGFEYAYGYLTEDGETLDSWNSPEYTAEAGEISESYFIDGYAKSFPNEDRARLFEHIYMGDGADGWQRSTALMAKAAYLCRGLRENFDSLAEAEDICWERALN